MSLLVAAHDQSAEGLAAAVAPYILGRWPWEARTTTWGALVVVGDGWAEADGWLILGRPQAHPWGVPGAPLSYARIGAELSRFGPAALQSSAGPIVALDLMDGGVVRAVNGIIPLFASRTGSWVTGTSLEATTAVTTDPLYRVPPGARAAPDGTVTLIADAFVPESVPGATWRNFQQELDAVMAPLGPRRIACLGATSAPSGAWARATWALDAYEELVFLPDTSVLEAHAAPLSRYLQVRDSVLPELWWASRLAGRWLCAPGFERPALDTVAMIGGRR